MVKLDLMSLAKFLASSGLTSRLKGCPTKRTSLILSSNFLSHSLGWTANMLLRTLLGNSGRFSARKLAEAAIAVDLAMSSSKRLSGNL